MQSRDYEELLASFNARSVRYLIIGAHAVAFHARPRATKDLDLFVEPTAENAEKVLAAIRDFFGGEDLGFTVQDLTTPGTIVQLGVAPARIDLLSRLASRIEFASAWERRSPGRFGSVETWYLSLEDLIEEKTSSGRVQDRADLRTLKRVRSGRP